MPTLFPINHIAIIPWGLSDIYGGTKDFQLLVNHLIQTLIEPKPIKGSAFTVVPNNLKACKNLNEDEVISKQYNFLNLLGSKVLI